MRRCAAVSSALAKLPNYTGTVVRGRNLNTPEEIAFCQPGAVVRERGFTSCDTLMPFPANPHFIIESKTGKNVSEHSIHGPNQLGPEREVLFNAGTKFQVHYNDIVEGRRVIYMKEV